MIQDQAICIGRRKYSESSQIVTLFGRASGRISSIAKGSRKEKSKFGGGIDLLMLGDIMYIPPRGDSALATLAEFHLTEPFVGLRDDLLALNCGQYMAEVVGDFTEDLDPHERLFNAFSRALGRLELSSRPEAVLVEFELALLREAGLTPTWGRCCGCGRELPATDKAYFSSAGGGAVCRDCEPAVFDKRLVETEVLRLLDDVSKISEAKLHTIIKAHGIMCYHQRELLGKSSAIMKFLNKLLLKRMNENQ